MPVSNLWWAEWANALLGPPCCRDRHQNYFGSRFSKSNLSGNWRTVFSGYWFMNWNMFRNPASSNSWMPISKVEQLEKPDFMKYCALVLKMRWSRKSAFREYCTPFSNKDKIAKRHLHDNLTSVSTFKYIWNQRSHRSATMASTSNYIWKLTCI